MASGKGDPTDEILDEEDEKANGVEGTSPDLPKPLVTGKQGNKSSIMPTKIKTTNLTL